MPDVPDWEADAGIEDFPDREAELGGAEDDPRPLGPADDHDPTGVDVARLIARTARGAGRPSPRPHDRKRGVVDPVFSGSHSDARDPQPLAKALDRVLAERGLTTGVNLHVLLGRWESLVGEVNAQHSKPEGYEDGVLTVRTDSTVWATSLRAIAPKLLARFADTLGSGAVTRIEVLGPVAPNWKKGRRAVEGRGPRDTYG